MNKEQIDEVFNYALTENLKEIFSLVGMQNEYTDEPNDELINEVLNRLMKKIEQGDYEYFLNKINDNDSNIRLICIELLKYSSKTEDKKNIINNWEKYGLDRRDLIDLLQSINEIEFTQKFIYEKGEELGLDLKDFIPLAQHSRDDKEFKNDINNPKSAKEFRQVEASTEEIYDNLDFYLEIEGKTKYKSSILRMYQKNNDILKCDFEILEYIEFFGEDKINLISCYGNITNQITKLSKTKLQILANCISYYEKQYATEDWTPLAEVILNNINNIDENLLQQILQQYNQNESHMENLIHLLINSNDMQITTIEEFNNYDEITQQKTDELIESDIADECKNAVLERAFNHSLDIAQSLIKKYGEDIDKIEDESLKKYIIALKEIVNLNDANILREVYKSIEPSKIQIPNVFAIEKMLKKEYAKLYNKELFKVENAERIEELGENVYDAGIDFRMMITSVRAYYNSNNPPENYYEDWNRPALSTQHFCCSYIRNDMMRTAPIPFVCFGFESMEEDSLVASGNGDIYSNNDEFVSAAEKDEVFLSPDNQIDATDGHNEVDYYRIQKGKKKQPDYIVVFKTNGQIKPEHLEYAKQSQRDFGGKLPIVIVDVDKCLESEKNKVNEMIATYKENPKQELVSQIMQKIWHNNLTCSNEAFNYDSDFDEDINLEGLHIASEMNIKGFDDIEAITKHVQGKSNLYNDFYKENGISEQVKLKDIIDVAEADKLGALLDKASKVQAQNKSTSLVHGEQHVKNVLLLSNYIGKRDGLSEEYMNILQEAAIYHDVMHERAGDPEHAKKGANWYYNNVSKNNEVAFLIAAHESKGKDMEELMSKLFTQGIDPERKAQLIKCAHILQDADRLDILRYNIENPVGQKFDANRLNDAQNASLIKAVIELNTRQAIKSGYLHTKDGKVCKKSVTTDRFVTDKDLQTCYKETTPEEREVVARTLSQRINQIDLVQDISEI